MLHTHSARVKRLDLKDDGVFNLCQRVANKLTRESLTKGSEVFWYAERNIYGYSQVIPVNFQEVTL